LRIAEQLHHFLLRDVCALASSRQGRADDLILLGMNPAPRNDPAMMGQPMAQAVPLDAPERRYALREVKARLHQASFRDAVLAAYGGRCAISHLPEPRLPDAAHIAQLIGIDSDSRIHVSDRLLEIHDGPFLEIGLKGIPGTLIDRPRRLEDRPDRDRLAFRFEHSRKPRYSGANGTS
jgi:hypothetical protein